MLPFFSAQLASPSRVRGGLLFGFVERDVLKVMFASTAGASVWYKPGARTVIDIDPRFALGWSEAVQTIHGTRFDWVGNWVSHADGQLRSQDRDLRRFKGAFRSGIADDEYLLLVVGYANGELKCRMYTDKDKRPPDAPKPKSSEQNMQSILTPE